MLERILVFLVICLAKNISSISLFIIPYDGEPVVYYFFCVGCRCGGLVILPTQATVHDDFSFEFEH